MAEYVEREFNPCDVCNYKRCGNCILHELAMKFVGHPAADVVEVVRCGECEKRDKSFISDNDTVCCPYMEAFMPKDGFCSYGERKDGEG